MEEDKEFTGPNARTADLSSLRLDRDKRAKPPGHWKKWLHLLWILVPVIGFLVYQVALKKAAPTVSVRTAKAELVTGSMASAELVATGYVVAQRKAAVSSKATGRLEVLNVEEGDRVKKGAVIARLENSDVQAGLDLAKATLAVARAESTDAELNFNRQTGLLKVDATTLDKVEAATARYQTALANVKAQKANVSAAGVALENTIIRAPFDGTVLTKEADMGEMVAPFASSSSSRGAVVTMADMGSLEVEADVSESNIQKVEINQPCQIVLDAYPAITYRGFVKKIVPTADRSRATVLTKVAFIDRDDKVLPEMSARVNFLSLEEKSAVKLDQPVVAVPKTAITQRQGKKVVFKVNGSLVEEIPVEIGRELGNITEIVSGISAGETVVLSPAGGLKSGDKIEITN
ncbi:MAG: efflux RND transporter periplasmic adaptor subunit [candidate division Zixibacteria bacterium]|nr:efflux RND transporter periplasmic adaptor subunit [candidate division Zixibacteria bacterium]